MRNRARNRIQSRLKLRQNPPQTAPKLSRLERVQRVELLAQKYEQDKKNGLDK